MKKQKNTKHNLSKIAREMNDPQSECIALGNLGLIARGEGKTKDAINYYQQTITLAQKLSDPTNLANAYWNMAKLYKDQSIFDNALESAKKALILYEKIKDAHSSNKVRNVIHE